MQATFTNTVGKIMAENQGVVNVTAGQINTETSGVKETTGEVIYTVDNVTNIGNFAFDSCTNLTKINYKGIRNKWNTVTFGEDWNFACPEIAVHCTDGDITIPANN